MNICKPFLLSLMLLTVYAAAPAACHAAQSLTVLTPVIAMKQPTDAPALTGVDVMIDVGHGGVDSGTFHGNVYEKDINLAVAQMVYQELTSRGYQVVLNRTGDYALSSENHWLRIRSRHIKDLAQRATLANEINPKVLISIHVNSARSPRKSGALLLHQKSEASKQLGKDIQISMNQLYGSKENPVYGKSYYLLKYAKCPSVIVEIGYLTNPQDRERMLSSKGQSDIATSISRGVHQYLQNKKPS